MRIFYTLLCLNIWSIAHIYAAGLPDPAFRLGGRDFSRDEARMLAGKHAQEKDWRPAIQANIMAAGTIVLCHRSGIELSKEKTAESLQYSLLIMPPEQRRKLDSQLQKEQRSEQDFIDQEAQKLTNQLNEALRRWYRKVSDGKSEIKPEHIQNWYFRNQDIFRRVKLKKDQLLIFTGEQKKQLQLVLDSLNQGMTLAAVKRAFALDAAAEKYQDELYNNVTKRQLRSDGYYQLDTENYTFLIPHDALEVYYVELNETLFRAIRDALFDALAKAHLAEALQQELANSEIEFY